MLIPRPGRAATRSATLAATALLALSAPALAQTDAFDQVGVGNATFTGTLAQEFVVGAQPIEVTRFGAFDDLGDGFNRTITVRIYDARTGLQVGSDVLFRGMVGSTVGSFRYLALEQPLVLPSGFAGMIAASGYGGPDERYYNAFFNDGARWQANDGGGLVGYGYNYYGEGATYPRERTTTFGNGWYGAGSFTFQPVSGQVSTVPEPATVALLGGGLAILGVAARRRRSR